MRLKNFAEKLGMSVLTDNFETEREVTGVYTCDLLSWVMSHANKGDAWITVLTNLNVAAVAMITEVTCVIIPEDIKVDEATIVKANKEGIVILGSSMSAYEICWKAHELLNT